MFAEGWVALVCASWFDISSDAVKYWFRSVADDVPVMPGLAGLHAAVTVSYTHLTLPTTTPV